jgi:hypothetical protein
MKKIIMVSTVIMVSMSLAFVLGSVLPFFKIEHVYGQQLVDNSLTISQRLGTTNILTFPGVNLLYGNGKAVPLDEEFTLLHNNTSLGTQNKVAISNPDYSLNDTISSLSIGQNFRINSTNEETIQYARVNVTLVPITSSLPPHTKISDIDPENDLMQQTPIPVGSYIGNIGNFVVPQVTHPGYYLLTVYLRYQSQGISAVYNTLIRIGNSSAVVHPAG